jgi:hypothetical protein
MIKNLRNGNIVFIVLFITAMFSLLFIGNNLKTHTDIVIVTATEEFIVDDYYQDLDKNCVYFIHDGDEKTICGNYEIIK